MKTQVTYIAGASRPVYIKAKCAYCNHENTWVYDVRTTGTAYYYKYPGFDNEEGKQEAIDNAKKYAKDALDSKIDNLISLSEKHMYNTVDVKCQCSNCGKVALWSSSPDNVHPKLSSVTVGIGFLSLLAAIVLLLIIIVNCVKNHAISQIETYKWIILAALIGVSFITLYTYHYNGKKWRNEVAEMKEEYLPIISLGQIIYK